MFALYFESAVFLLRHSAKRTLFFIDLLQIQQLSDPIFECLLFGKDFQQLIPLQTQVSYNCDHQVYRLVHTHYDVLSSRHVGILKAYDFQRVRSPILYKVLISLLIVNAGLPINQSYSIVFFRLLDKVLVVDVREVSFSDSSTKGESCLLVMGAVQVSYYLFCQILLDYFFVGRVYLKNLSSTETVSLLPCFTYIESGIFGSYLWRFPLIHAVGFHFALTANAPETNLFILNGVEGGFFIEGCSNNLQFVVVIVNWLKNVLMKRSLFLVTQDLIFYCLVLHQAQINLLDFSFNSSQSLLKLCLFEKHIVIYLQKSDSFRLIVLIDRG